VLGYGRAAREQALGLRRSGNDVAIGLRLGGMSWVRARKDGFEAHAPAVLVGGAEVVVVLVPDDEQASVYCHAIEPLLAPNALLVFSRGLALGTRVFEPSKHDVVFVTGESTDASGRTRCRVAVHHDATGHALERAIAYARAAFGADAEVGTTTVAAEVDAELSSMVEHAGSVQELSASVERLLARVRDNHAPEEAKVAFYEGLRELVAKRMHEYRAHDRGSDVSLRFWPAPSGGRA
jgi:ketol-acid reductoisomerase